MTIPRETLTFDTRHVGRRVDVFDSVTSTNDLAATAEPGTVIVAEHQTAGRGQYGRVWSERPGTSLLMSVVLRPEDEFRRPVALTAWATVAVCETVDQLTGRSARVKWPNDVLVDGKKVCGILIEQRGVTVVGVGMNLNQSADDFTSLGLTQATSLALLSGSFIDPRTALTVLLRRLDESYENLPMIESRWKTRLGLFGRQVIADRPDGTRVYGRLRDLSFNGVELETDGPESVCVLKPENIRHLSAV